MKLLSHRLGLGGTLVLYGMTMGGKDSNDIWVMLLDTGVGVFLLQTRGGQEERREKLYNRAVLFIGRNKSRISTSVLFTKVTHLAQSISDKEDSSMEEREVLHEPPVLIWESGCPNCMLKASFSGLMLVDSRLMIDKQVI